MHYFYTLLCEQRTSTKIYVVTFYCKVLELYLDLPISSFFLTRSYDGIYGLPFETNLAQNIGIFHNDNVFACRCVGILRYCNIGLGYTFQNLRPWCYPVSGAAFGGQPPCLYPCNNNHISNNENGCLIFEDLQEPVELQKKKE